jgi:PAS domain S-box-containing protein
MAAGGAPSLQLLVEQLRESEERFRAMADCAPVMLWMAGTDALCNFFNKTWLDFSGRTMADEMHNGWAEAVHFEDFQRCMHTYLDAFVEHRPFRMEYRLRRADGQFRWILDTGVPRFAPGGGFAGYIGSCIDITEIREASAALKRLNSDLEQRVAERTADLQRSNEDLEEFSYAVSHDLQEPLRTISGFVGLLEKRYREGLDPEARDFLDFIADGAQRMHAMVADVLMYARAGRPPPAELPISLDRALDQALKNLAAAMQDAGATVERTPLPRVVGDEGRLVMVFQNLVGNAVKFRGTEAPRVRIGAQDRGEQWQVTVADNGIGIPVEAQDRVFRVFQRLHTREQYPGTGVGLALCKRIVEARGGRIWFESAPGRGTAFHFTWPRAPEPQ